MYLVVITGLDSENGKIRAGLDSVSKNLDSEEELDRLLHILLEAEIEDYEVTAKLFVQGNGQQVEVLRDGSRLVLNDRNDPNRQGIPVQPNFFSGSGEGEESADPEEDSDTAPVKVKSKSSLWPVILVAIALTVVIQILLLRQSAPEIVAGAPPKEVSAAEFNGWLDSWQGFYLVDFGADTLAVHLQTEGSYQLFRKSGPREDWELFESGTLSGVRSRNTRGFLLNDELYLAMTGDNQLDYYGFIMDRVPLPADLNDELPNLP